MEPRSSSVDVPASHPLGTVMVTRNSFVLALEERVGGQVLKTPTVKMMFTLLLIERDNNSECMRKIRVLIS